MSSNATAGNVSSSVRDVDDRDVFAIVYPNLQTAVAISLLQLLGTSLITIFLAQRVKLEDFKSIQALGQISLPRLYLMMLFLLSWAFFAFTTVLIHGIGLDLSRGACEAGILGCITLYSGSKLFAYLFLGERVHIVWCPTLTTPRYKSPLYLLSVMFVVAYLVIVCHLYVVRIAKMVLHDICMIGLKLDGVILLVTFDVIISIVMTFLFIWPLLRSSFRQSHLRHIAKRSVTAAFVALSTSCVNISLLAAMGGKQFGWMFITCWGGDVLVSAIAFFWLTSGSGLRPIASIAAAQARARSESQRRSDAWLHRTLTNATLSTFIDIQSDLRRQSSLPTIMTHEMIDELSASDLASPVTVPKLVLTTEQAWPVLPVQRLVSQPAPGSDLSTTVVSTEEDAESVEISSQPCTLDDWS